MGPFAATAFHSAPRTKTSPSGASSSRASPFAPRSASDPVVTGRRRAIHTLRMKKTKNPAVTAAAMMAASGLTPSPMGPVLMRNAIPNSSATTPPALRIPCVLALISAMKRTSASNNSRAPARFTGRLARENRARCRELSDDAVGRQQDQKRGDSWIDKGVQEDHPERHRKVLNLSAGSVERQTTARTGNDLAVNSGPQRGRIRRLQVGDVELDGLLGVD